MFQSDETLLSLTLVRPAMQAVTDREDGRHGGSVRRRDEESLGVAELVITDEASCLFHGL